ncbi:MAG: HesA/MoeB/ThiF family protein [Chitinispirillia bacterium]|jgi:adenylyltransferase/sulfurtransferase
MINFSHEQLQRYKRNILLKGMGKKGQERLLESKVIIIGAGGLGSSAIYYLASAGVGTIGIVDSDIVDLTNLQRQIIHSTDDLNTTKVESAKSKINKLNPDVNVVVYNERATKSNICDFITNYRFIIDATDNFSSKYLLNDACYFENKPYSHAGVLGFNGQTMTVIPGTTSCLRCLLPKIPSPDAASGSDKLGILGAVAGMMGAIQASEAIKYLTGMGKLLANRLLVIDAMEMTFRSLTIKKNTKCPLCGSNPTITGL